MAAVTAFCLAGMPGMGGPERTNVLFIVADDLNDWVGCLGGHPLVKTPHIDALAQRGVVFTNAHCQAPLCNPSRTSVLLGKRPETTGIYGLKPWFRDVSGLREAVSLPQYFSRNGYRTLATGKIFHGRFGMRKEDREFDVTGPGYDDGPYPLQRIAALPGRQNRGNDWGVVGGRDEERGDWKIASWAVELLRSAPQFPFFLSVGIRLPHVPLFATQQWFDLYPDDQSVLPLVKRGDRGILRVPRGICTGNSRNTAGSFLRGPGSGRVRSGLTWHVSVFLTNRWAGSCRPCGRAGWRRTRS